MASGDGLGAPATGDLLLDAPPAAAGAGSGSGGACRSPAAAAERGEEASSGAAVCGFICIAAASAAVECAGSTPPAVAERRGDKLPAVGKWFGDVPGALPGDKPLGEMPPAAMPGGTMQPTCPGGAEAPPGRGNGRDAGIPAMGPGDGCGAAASGEARGAVAMPGMEALEAPGGLVPDGCDAAPGQDMPSALNGM